MCWFEIENYVSNQKPKQMHRIAKHDRDDVISLSIIYQKIIRNREQNKHTQGKNNKIMLKALFFLCLFHLPNYAALFRSP